ncbi:hypothetical protein [Nocardiopsis sp. HUAS JQ3]|nr:hypothetical protein [Nocardiopsis sp. HUAS JQ3]WDZ92309.1 hypothetical protein PV789_07165 [Nocardiopsis sp. HUAS JQ3]
MPDPVGSHPFDGVRGGAAGAAETSPSGGAGHTTTGAGRPLASTPPTHV